MLVPDFLLLHLTLLFTCNTYLRMYTHHHTQLDTFHQLRRRPGTIRTTAKSLLLFISGRVPHWLTLNSTLLLHLLPFLQTKILNSFFFVGPPCQPIALIRPSSNLQFEKEYLMSPFRCTPLFISLLLLLFAHPPIPLYYFTPLFYPIFVSSNTNPPVNRPLAPYISY